MPSPRSLFASWHNDNSHFDSETDIKRPHGPRFWQKRRMNNEQGSEATPFSLPSMFTPLSPTTNMPQTHEQPKPSPHLMGYDSHRSQHTNSEYESFVRKSHQHTLSDSINTTGSNESSPTTTISTVDDSSATEPSPGSSPESPPPTTFAIGMMRPRTADERNAPFFELQKQPPPRKGRNLKNLAVVTARNSARAASTTNLPLRAEPDANVAIFSPSFVKPPTPPRRRPSNLGLTILTPAAGKAPPQEMKLMIPPTPGFSRPGALRHFQSSPSLPLLPGLGLPQHIVADYQRQQVLNTIYSPIEPPVDSTQISEEAGAEEENFDIPLSREEKPEAYPDGPICVYDPHIDLYLEPTAEQARHYDVIMNVASEVRNPLLDHGEPAGGEPEVRIDGGGGIQFAPRKDRDHLVVSKESASLPEGSPTTPKASPLHINFPVEQQRSNLRDPEYIHIPWEHNSDIVPDLLRLCKDIDDKVTQGKRILIHCQCGVSRSASLVVAYGLYKNPTMTVQEAYDAVKRRSKWIGPNMNLIMQLQEFRSSLARGGLLTTRSVISPMTPASALSVWNGPFSTKSPAMLDEPLSAVEPPSSSAISTDGQGIISPGPSSAPSGLPWPPTNGTTTQRARAISASKSATAYVDPSGHVLAVQPLLPVLKIIAADASNAKPLGPVRQISSPEGFSSVTQHGSVVSSPRSSHFAMAPLNPSKEVNAADSFGIMSPTSTELSSNPFDRTALLASLGMGSMRADEEKPRRSHSLRNRQRQQGSHALSQAYGQQNARLEPATERRLRGKISSPSLREQRSLQKLQAEIEAKLHLNGTTSISSPVPEESNEPLMSPRATEFTSNPFALSLTVPPPASEVEGAQRAADFDPRSPAHKGASPIVRSILDIL